MVTVRVPVRSAPRTHEATSAMSAVCRCTSSAAGSVMAGGRRLATRSATRRAASAIRARATSGC